MNKVLVAGMSMAAVVMGVAAAPVSAQTSTFDFTNGNSSTVGAAGNARSFTNNLGTIVVTATAWSLDTANGTPVAAYLGWYDKGLGVTNSITGNAKKGYSSDDNSHTIDNIGRFDFVSLTFTAVGTGAPVAVQLRYGALTPVGFNDNDPSVSFTIDKQNQGILDSAIKANLILHTTELEGNMKSSEGYLTNLNPGMNTGNIWTVGADRLFAINTDLDDGFKLSGISVQIPTPEPASWAMMIGGFGIAGGALRRRRSGQRALALA